MPVTNGVELCLAIREQEQIREMPAIMLTARGYALDADDMERTGIRTVLNKPFSPREMLATVEGVLSDSDVEQLVE